MITNPKNFKFAIFGKIIYTDYFIKELHKRGFPKPVIFTSLDDEYLRDERLLSKYGLYSDLENLVKQNLVTQFKVKDVNTETVLKLLIENKCNIGLSMSCRNIIKKQIIGYFKNRIFNIHDSYLPDERGGALNTWRILNGINSVGDTIHYLDEGIDSGNIILQNRIKLKIKYPKPIDYLKAENINCQKLLNDFIEIILSVDKISSKKQDDDLSLYFPRLFTEVNGAINWDWPIDKIEKFIRAFSDPYPGAFTYYKNQRVYINDATIDDKFKHDFHPFVNGKIVTVFKNKDVRVISGGGALIIKTITVNGIKIKPGDLLSTRFSLITDLKHLNNSKSYLASTKKMSEKEITRNKNG